VPIQPTIFGVSCEDLRRELVSFMEGSLAPEFSERIEQHLKNCHHCKVVFDGARNVVSLLGDKAVFQLPEGFSQRLRHKLSRIGAGDYPSKG
jgi:hypothetical protein